MRLIWFLTFSLFHFSCFILSELSTNQDWLTCKYDVYYWRYQEQTNERNLFLISVGERLELPLAPLTKRHNWLSKDNKELEKRNGNITGKYVRKHHRKKIKIRQFSFKAIFCSADCSAPRSDRAKWLCIKLKEYATTERRKIV